jgi:hypothetical protein
VKEGIKGIRETTRDGATKEGITEKRERDRRLDSLKVIAVIGKKEVSRRSQCSWRHIYTSGLSVAALKFQTSEILAALDSLHLPASRPPINHHINCHKTIIPSYCNISRSTATSAATILIICQLDSV